MIFSALHVLVVVESIALAFHNTKRRGQPWGSVTTSRMRRRGPSTKSSAGWRAGHQPGGHQGVAGARPQDRKAARGRDQPAHRRRHRLCGLASGRHPMGAQCARRRRRRSSTVTLHPDPHRRGQRRHQTTAAEGVFGPVVLAGEGTHRGADAAIRRRECTALAMPSRSSRCCV